MKKAYIMTGLGIAVLAGVLAFGPGRVWIESLVHGGTNATSVPTAEKTAQKPAQQAPAVTLETVTRGVFRRFISLSGSVEAATVAGLASPAEGPVLDCSVREGDRVRAGQPIVRIGRQASAQAVRAAAAEELRRQQVEYRRVATLVEGRALPADQLDLAKSSLERAKAAMIQANQSAGDYVVTAPWAGIVAQVRVADGNFVAPRAPLVDIYDPASLVLRFGVAEDQAFALKVGTKILAAFDGLAGKEFELEVVRAYPGLDRATRTRTFEASLPEGDFVPGMFARLRAVLQEEEAAVTVSVDAVLTQGGKRDVFVVRDGQAERRQIETGFEQDGRVVVLSGLHEGERVVVGGIERVKDGAAVRAQADPAAKNATSGAAS